MKSIVKNKIIEIKREFEENHHKFLGEEDIRCHLFSKLLDEFNNLETTEDGKQTISLHAQISFKSPNNDLKTGEKPDILIIDVPSTNLYTDKGIKPQFMLSKGFQFRKAPIGIEIKLSWKKGIKAIKNQISKEVEKIKNLQERNSEMFFYFIYFDKNGRLTETDINSLNGNLKDIEIIYCRKRIQ